MFICPVVRPTFSNLITGFLTRTVSKRLINPES